MKEKWKTLLQAMIIPTAYVCIFVVAFALPILQEYQEFNEQMGRKSIGSFRISSIWSDPSFFPMLLLLIVHPIAVFFVGTIILYFVIGYLKKKRRQNHIE